MAFFSLVSGRKTQRVVDELLRKGGGVRNGFVVHDQSGKRLLRRPFIKLKINWRLCYMYYLRRGKGEFLCEDTVTVRFLQYSIHLALSIFANFASF